MNDKDVNKIYQNIQANINSDEKKSDKDEKQRNKEKEKHEKEKEDIKNYTKQCEYTKPKEEQTTQKKQEGPFGYPEE